ncbi:MAG: 50S ribosomal protein L21 [Actinobacteria bacterium 13_1_40CM_66_12]|nr:MAG: 50S ribosomal protein L21 [Actinobacteria bacterium 13_1_40CM_66_12]
MPKPDGSLSAVVVSGGKQYRVAPGDKILVDRLAAELGSSVKLGPVLLVHDGSDIKVGAPAVDGIEVDAKVMAHSRGPRIETLRYKSKKRVRVHRGGRADYTALEILAVGGLTVATGTAVAEPEAKPAKGRGAKRATTPKVEAKAEVETAVPAEEKPKRAARKPKQDDK